MKNIFFFSKKWEKYFTLKMKRMCFCFCVLQNVELNTSKKKLTFIMYSTTSNLVIRIIIMHHQMHTELHYIAVSVHLRMHVSIELVYPKNRLSKSFKLCIFQTVLYRNRFKCCEIPVQYGHNYKLWIFSPSK